AAFATLCRQITNEPPNDRGAVIKWRSGRRYGGAFVALDGPRQSGVPGLKTNGVYVIVGGSGNIGRALTRQLIERYRATVVWVGRTPAEAVSLRERIDTFRELGSAPSYVCADVTDEGSTAAAIRDIK